MAWYPPGGVRAMLEFSAAHEQWKNHGLERRIKELGLVAAKWGWHDIFPADQKRLLRARMSAFCKAVSTVEYSRTRQAQIWREDSPFRFVVWRTGPSLLCEGAHFDLDGVILAADHPFWDRYMPPLGWDCSCCIYGASSYEGALRLGGEIGLPLPDWARRLDLPLSIDNGPFFTTQLFATRQGPSQQQILEAIARGDADLF
jgi:hypothetical protein